MFERRNDRVADLVILGGDGSPSPSPGPRNGPRSPANRHAPRQALRGFFLWGGSRFIFEPLIAECLSRQTENGPSLATRTGPGADGGAACSGREASSHRMRFGEHLLCLSCWHRPLPVLSLVSRPGHRFSGAARGYGFRKGENASRRRQGSRAFFLLALYLALLAFSFFAFNGSSFVRAMIVLPAAQSEPHKGASL